MRERLLEIIRTIREFLRKKLRYQSEDVPYYLTFFIAGLFFILAVKAFIELADELAENELGTFDSFIAEFIFSFRSAWLTKVLTFITHLGDRNAYLFIILSLAVFFWSTMRNWKYTVQIIVVLVISSATNVLVKQVIHRERPLTDHLVEVNTLSFPSGHSMSAMAFYGFLIYLAVSLKINSTVKVVITSFLSLLILLIGISRIYLGVHYPSDVAAGFAGGLIWVTFCAILLNLFQLWNRKKN